MMRLIPAVIVLLTTTAVSLAADEWEVDKNHSKIYFTVKHMVISEVLGTFREFEMTVKSSKDDLSDLKVEAIVPVRTITTDVERRDNHLRSDDFFGAEKFPHIRFTSTEVQKVGQNTFKIYGNLTIRDVTKPVLFEAVHNGTLKSERGLRAGWRAIATINRFDFGLKWNNTIETGGLVVGEKVNIVVDLEITKPAQP